MSLSPENAWDVFTRLQKRFGKTVRLGGSAQLMAWVRPEFRRKVKDVDIVTLNARMGSTIPVRMDNKEFYVDILHDTLKHPLFVYMHKIPPALPVTELAHKVLEDFRRVHKTYEFLRRHRSPEIAEMYLEDLAHAFAKSVEATMRQRERDRFALLFEPDPQKTIPNSFQHIASKDPELGRFLVHVLRRGMRYLPEKYRRALENAWRRVLKE